MAFKDVISKIQRSILCCSKREKLDIGSPTDVRRVDVSDALPGLTDAERKYIREKASSDAIHLLGLQSHSPSHPPSEAATAPPSPEHSLRREPDSVMSSREPSMALLNAASKNLPDVIPTPPCQTHPPNSPPSARMKTMWDGAKRLSGASSCRDSAYSKIGDSSSLHSAHTTDRTNNNNEMNNRDSSFITLNLEFELQNPRTRFETPQTLSLASGFETQDTIGGHADTAAPIVRNEKVQSAIKETEIDSSDDEDPFITTTDGKLLDKD
ncbi:hypothetical protein N0V94_007354 [Neodidymelliopsis sp. IMI 364377]|nr:hypothetical protein N0V94_007354 [Neodidymelliopsis sp. IMI 364377]